MKILVQSAPLESIQADALVILFTHNETFGSSADLSLQQHLDFYRKSLDSGSSKAEWFCTLENNSTAKTRHLLLYSDSFAPPMPGTEALKTAAARCVEICRQYSLSHLVFGVMGSNPINQGLALLEGIFLGDFLDQRYKSAPTERPELTIEFVTTPEHEASLKDAVNHYLPVLSAVNQARELVNAPNNHLTPSHFIAHAEELALRHDNLTLTVVDHEELEADGYNLIHAVGVGSADHPALLILKLAPENESDEPGIFLVGKGVCFDTGGLCIKDGKDMHKMNGDMAGAAAVMEAMIALAERKTTKKITAIIPLAVNSISSTAMLPGSIIAAKNGRTVYIENTDAEGRLILADAFCRAVEEGLKSGDCLIDLATLTGAAAVALGERLGALFTDDAELASVLQEAGAETGDNLWPLPLWEEYAPSLKHPLADLCNMSSQSPAGGAIHAANFLKEFVPAGVRWAHIDMSRPARAAKATRYYKEGATGYGVRLLVAAVEDLSND